MKIKIVYPKWEKIKYQTEFHLPPHGPVCFAAALPDDVDVVFCDENVEELDMEEGADLIAMSVMLTCQIQRAWRIADDYRARGVPVIFGGIGTMLHAEETMQHADAVFLGEAEGYIDRVIEDLRNGCLKKLYNFMDRYADTSVIGPARRDVLNRELYNYRGIQMVDLVHASRGCRFNCFPCCTPYLGGRRFRPRPIEKVVEEIGGIDNNRLFFVDNSLAQDDEWEKELFRALMPLKKKWISHPIKDDDEILDLAAEAGCWYVYQAIFDTSDIIRNRVRRLKERGIGVEGTIILGLDDHDEDYIKRLVDFLMEINLDLAEFTVLTPFPHSSICAKLQEEGRILDYDWWKYSSADVVFRPARMSVEKLGEMYDYAWKAFYKDASQEIKMANLFMQVIAKEKNDGTFRRRQLGRTRWSDRKGGGGGR
jgi:radical SAM superfamily enzyme YgiQ (UPF0313 family)